MKTIVTTGGRERLAKGKRAAEAYLSTGILLLSIYSASWGDTTLDEDVSCRLVIPIMYVMCGGR